MITRKLLLLIVIAAIALNLSGCIGVNSEFRKIRNHVFEKMNLDYSKKFEFSVGAAGLALAGTFVSFADTDEPVGEIISNISRVQIGIYDRRDINLFSADAEDLNDFVNAMEEQGWQYIVKSLQHDGLTAVFVDGDAEYEINEIFVVAVEDDEMVLAEVHGNLEGVVEAAIRGRGLNFNTSNTY